MNPLVDWLTTETIREKLIEQEKADKIEREMRVDAIRAQLEYISTLHKNLSTSASAAQIALIDYTKAITNTKS